LAATSYAQPGVVELLELEQPTDVRFKRPPTALRAYLDLDRAEGKRRHAIRSRRRILRRTLAVADVIAVAIALKFGAGMFGDHGLQFGAYAAIVLMILMMKTAGLYDRDAHLLRRATLDEVPALFEVGTLGILLIWLLAGRAVIGDVSRPQLLGMWMLLFVMLIVGRSLARAIATQLTDTERCLVIGDSDAATALRSKLQIDGSESAEIVGWIPGEEARAMPSGGSIPMLPQGLFRILAERQVHRVIVVPGKVDSDALLHLIRELSDMEVAVSILPATPPVAGSSVELDHLHGLTLLGARGFEMGRSSRMLKRCFDLVASASMLVLAAPLMLAIAIAIKLDSPGPVLFRQRRIGRGGSAFEMLKFRSMYEGSEALREKLSELNEVQGLFKIERDPRVTRVGDVIRRLALDELPQLLNVLRGEMSLVGPRPLVPDEDSQIEGMYRRRLDLAPGITGYWQALGASRIPLFEMVRLDYLYVATWSLWNDARILLRTVPFVIRRRGR
jgi:exopolysaccharide biosynthesis polyprenyl glycosylphosphotransferase